MFIEALASSGSAIVLATSSTAPLTKPILLLIPFAKPCIKCGIHCSYSCKGPLSGRVKPRNDVTVSAIFLQASITFCNLFVIPSTNPSTKCAPLCLAFVTILWNSSLTRAAASFIAVAIFSGRDPKNCATPLIKSLMASITLLSTPLKSSKAFPTSLAISLAPSLIESQFLYMRYAAAAIAAASNSHGAAATVNSMNDAANPFITGIRAAKAAAIIGPCVRIAPIALINVPIIRITGPIAANNKPNTTIILRIGAGNSAIF